MNIVLTTQQNITSQDELQKAKAVIPKEPLPSIIQQQYLNLASVFLELSSFKNVGNLVFRGHLTLQITNEFNNPENCILEAIKGLSIKAGLINNAGDIFSSGKGELTAHVIDNSKGRILIASDAEVTAYSSFKNTDGKVEVEGLLKMRGGAWSNKAGLFFGKKGIDGQIKWLKNKDKGLIKSSQGPVKIVTETDLRHMGVMEAFDDISLRSQGGQVWIENGMLMTPKKILLLSDFSHDGWETISIQASFLQANQLELRGAGHIRVEDSHINQALFIVQGDTVSILRSHFEDLDGIDITSGRANVNDTVMDSRGHTKIQANELNLEQVKLKSKNEIMLAGSTLLHIEESSLISEEGSVYNSSENQLTIIKTATVAKKGIRQLAKEIIEEESYDISEEGFTQKGKSLNSKNVQHFSDSTLIIQMESLHTTGLTGSARGILLIQVNKVARLAHSCFHSEEAEIHLSSKLSYLDVSHSKLSGRRLMLAASKQIVMQKSEVKLTEDMAAISEEGWIEAQHLVLDSEGGDSQFEALKGTVYMDLSDSSSKQKIMVQGKFLQTSQMKVEADKGLLLKGQDILAKDSEFGSKEGPIDFESSQSMWLEQVRKSALQGRITETSQNWILEKENVNEAKEIVRSAPHVELSNTQDRAKTITNSTSQTATFRKYKAEAESKITFLLKGESFMDESDLKGKTVEFRVDTLWLQTTKHRVGQLKLTSQSLFMRKNEIKSHLCLITNNGKASLSENDLQNKINKIRAGELGFFNNQVNGNQDLNATDKLIVVDNNFKEGSQNFEGKNIDLIGNKHEDTESVTVKSPQGNLKSVQNEIDTGIYELEAKTVTSQEDMIHTTESAHMKAEDLAFRKTEITSEGEIELEAQKSLNISTSKVEGEEQVEIKAATSHVQDSTLSSPSGDLRSESKQSHIDHSTFKSERELSISNDESTITNSKLTSQTVSLQTTESLLFQKNEVISEELTSVSQEAIFDDNQITTEESHFQAQQILFSHNKTEGNQEFAAENDLTVLRNDFTGGSQDFEGKNIDLIANKHESTESVTIKSSLGNVHSVQNEIDTGTYELEAKTVTSQEDKIHTTESAHMKADDLLLRKTEITSEEEIGLEAQRRLDISTSTIEGEQQVEFKGQQSRIQGSTLSSLAGGIELDLGKAQITDSNLKSQDQQNITFTDLTLAHSFLTSQQSDISLDGNNMFRSETVMKAANVTEGLSETCTSVNSTTVVKERLTRTAEEVFNQGGTDQAEQISEESYKTTHLNHKMETTEKLTLDAERMSIYGSEYKAKDLDIISQELNGSKNLIQVENELALSAQKLQMPNNTFQAPKMDFEGEYHNYSQSQFVGDVTLKEGLEQVGLQGVSVVGNLEGQGLGDVLASGIHVTGDVVNLAAENIQMSHAVVYTNESFEIQVENLAHLNKADVSSVGSVAIGAKNLDGRELKVKANKEIDIQTEEHAELPHTTFETDAEARFNAKSMNMNDSTVTAQSITQEAEETISAVNSKLTAEEEITQIGTAIDVEKAELRAGKKITQEAYEVINHQKTVQVSPLNEVRTPILDNREGAFHGGLDFDVGTIHNEGGKYNIDENVSTIRADREYNNSQSKITGPGKLNMELAEPYTLQSKVEGMGALSIASPEITIDTKVKADAISLESEGKVKINADAELDTRITKIVSDVFENPGSIISDIVHIEQTKFTRDIGNVTARTLLRLVSDSSILVTERWKIDSSLELVSREFIEVDAEMAVKGNLLMEGKEGVDVYKRLDVIGQGVFKSKNDVQFHQTTGKFGKGIRVNARDLVQHQSHLEVKGNSSIHARNWHLESAVKKPSRKNSRNTYTVLPSSFKLRGDLDLNVSNTITNDASDILIRGNVNANGHHFLNKNRSHIHSYQKVVGIVKSKKKLFGGHKKKKIRETCHDLVIDRLANTQIKGTVNFNFSGKFSSDGLFAAQNMQGKIAHLDVGNFSTVGQTPRSYSLLLPKIMDLPPLKLGGFLYVAQDMHLDVQRLHVNGFIEAGNINSIKSKSSLIERRVVLEKGQIAKVHKGGKISRKYTSIDKVEDGGKLEGRILVHRADQGVLVGGRFHATDLIDVEMKEFKLKPVVAKSIVQLNPRVSYFKSAKASSVKTDFIGSKVISGRDYRIKVNNVLGIDASEILGMGKGYVEVGSLDMKTRFSSHLSKTKNTSKRKENLADIVMVEPKLRTVKGPLTVKGQSNLNFMGEFGSYEGKFTIGTDGDIFFNAAHMSAVNRVSTLSLKGYHNTYQSKTFNTFKVSLPHLIAGNGFEVKKGKHLQATGIKADIKGPVILGTLSHTFEPYKIDRFEKTKTVSLSVKCTGSDALVGALQGNKPKQLVESLLREDSGLNSLYNLLGSKDTVSALNHSIISGLQVWNEVAQFSEAFNKGSLLNSLGEHFGLTDGAGQFSPRVSVSLNVSKTKKAWEEIFLPTLNINGDFISHTPIQTYIGSVIRATGYVDLKGKIATMDSATTKMKQSSSSIGATVSYGAEGWGGGGSFSKGKAKGTTHYAPVWDVRGNISMIFTDRIKMTAQIEGHDIYIKAPKIDIESKQDEFSQKQVGFSADSSGQGSFSASSHKTSQVNKGLASIKARGKGTVKGDSISTKGVLTENMFFDTPHLQGTALRNEKKGQSIGITFTIPKTKTQEVETPNSASNVKKSPAIPLLGTVDFESFKHRGKTQTTIVGGNGDKFQGVNTDPKKLHEWKKKKKTHVATPIVNVLTIDPEKLSHDWSQIKQAFGKSSPEVTPPPKQNTSVIPETVLLQKRDEDRAKEPVKKTKDFLSEKKSEQKKIKKTSESSVIPKGKETIVTSDGNGFFVKRLEEQLKSPTQGRPEKPLANRGKNKNIENRWLKLAATPLNLTVASRYLDMGATRATNLGFKAISYPVEVAVERLGQFSTLYHLSGQILFKGADIRLHQDCLQAMRTLTYPQRTLRNYLRVADSYLLRKETQLYAVLPDFQIRAFLNKAGNFIMQVAETISSNQKKYTEADAAYFEQWGISKESTRRFHNESLENNLNIALQLIPISTFKELKRFFSPANQDFAKQVLQQKFITVGSLKPVPKAANTNPSTPLIESVTQSHTKYSFGIPKGTPTAANRNPANTNPFTPLIESVTQPHTKYSFGTPKSASTAFNSNTPHKVIETFASQIRILEVYLEGMKKEDLKLSVDVARQFNEEPKEKK